MSSALSTSPPDDYADLATPWKPVGELAMKNFAGAHKKDGIDQGPKDQDIAIMESADGIIPSHVDAEHQDVDASDTDSVNTDMIVGDGAREYSAMEGSGMEDVDNTNGDNSVGDGAQVDGANMTDADDNSAQQIDSKCVAVSTCVANSGDHRKVVSHIFGRNKACTRELPNNLWIFWCRKHYQRLKYRAEDAENWHLNQLGLVRQQLQTFEEWGKVQNWTIALRKTEQDALAKENKLGLGYVDYVSSCWERFLVPYLGPNKTFGQVREVLKVIADKFEETEYRNRAKKMKIFPGVEFLPTIQKVKETTKPAAKKDTGYRKITLDQPAFSRKTRANNEYIAAKKAETSKTPKSSRSRSSSKKVMTPDTSHTDYSDACAGKKRKISATDDDEKDAYDKPGKSTDAAIVTPYSKALPSKSMSTPSTAPASPVSEPASLPCKRRRLTRGFEKHGLDGEESSVMDMEQTEEAEGSKA